MSGYLRKLKQLAVRASVVFTLIVLVLWVTPLVPWLALKLALPWGEAKGDILIVLGGDQMGDGNVGGTSFWRCYYAGLHWRRGGFREVVFSGGGQLERSVGDAMAECGVVMGIPRAAIIVEGRSRSTRENAIEVAKLLNGKAGKKILLTSDYHMLRARQAFQTAGLEVVGAPFPDINRRWSSWAARGDSITILAQELVKLVYYKARGWI